MQATTTIAKSVFQVHGIDADGQVVIRRQLKRRSVLAFFQKLPPCLVGIEACASSHYWSRELKELGHTVRLMPPAYVKPYVKRQKNDAADAEAICEAVTRANTRFVATKTPEQQSGLVLHRTRHLFILPGAVISGAGWQEGRIRCPDRVAIEPRPAEGFVLPKLAQRSVPQSFTTRRPRVFPSMIAAALSGRSERPISSTT
jgi:hypothetical protein